MKSGPTGTAKPTIAILHYSAPPVVGGVESTIYHHACLLAEAGYPVRVIAGRGEPFHPAVAFHGVPELDSRHPEVLAVKQELDAGCVSLRFYGLLERISIHLRPLLAACDVLILHNIFTLHKNLPLSAALHGWLTEKPAARPRVLAWHHDLAWRNPQYRRELHAGYPWELLRQPWPGVVHVTVSEPRRREVAALYGIAYDAVQVVPPGMDLAGFLRWTETTRRVVQSFSLLDADLVLLLPARITRRKNIALALRALQALRRQSGLDARLLVTGPPGAHNPANSAYLQSLLALRQELELMESVHFVYELGDGQASLVPDRDTMLDLFSLADALLFPSLEEGFGIPILEAGLVRVPVFCSDIAPLRATGDQEVYYFAPDADPESVAALIGHHLLTDRAFRLRRRVLKEYRWERILRTRIIPLIEGASGQKSCLRGEE